MRLPIVFLILLGLVPGCAHFRPETAGTESLDGGPATEDQITSFRLSEAQGLDESEPEFEAIPEEVNPLVHKWVDYFQGKGRDHMERYLSRSKRYEKLMKKVLKDNGLPPDLFYIALIESGFSSQATSRAAAVGYWQFIRGTGKRYGLQINRLVDERRDPVLATQAAAEYFKGLYSVFGSWYLAMASYNAGENRIKKEVMRNYTRDFWELARKRRLPRETVHYIPKYLAARMIAKNPEKFGFEGIDYMDPIEFDQVELHQPVNLKLMAEKMNSNYEDFKALNPKYRGEIAPLNPQGSLVLRIPPDMKEAALTAAAESIAKQVEFVADADTQTYRVKSGDSLYRIARKFRTTVAYLRDINDLPRGRKLRIGMRLQVPDRTPMFQKSRSNASRGDKDSGAATRRDPASSGVQRYHIVRRGDSLFEIAKKYSLTLEQLKRENNIGKGETLRVGTKLRLPALDEQSSRHRIRRGDNLQSIAARYNTSVSEIRKLNGIRDPRKLLVGNVLLIPATASE